MFYVDCSASAFVVPLVSPGPINIEVSKHLFLLRNVFRVFLGPCITTSEFVQESPFTTCIRVSRESFGKIDLQLPQPTCAKRSSHTKQMSQSSLLFIVEHLVVLHRLLVDVQRSVLPLSSEDVSLIQQAHWTRHRLASHAPQQHADHNLLHLCQHFLRLSRSSMSNRLSRFTHLCTAMSATFRRPHSLCVTRNSLLAYFFFVLRCSMSKSSDGVSWSSLSACININFPLLNSSILCSIIVRHCSVIFLANTPASAARHRV